MRPDLTQAQRDWMAAHPHYCFPGRPKPGVSYKECGTLYADGRFDPMESMKPVRLEEGCILVGVPSDLYLTEPAPFDYTALDGPALLSVCADDASNWASAFCQHAKKLGHEIDEGWMIGWFANAIENSWDVRTRRAQPATKCVAPAIP